MLLELDKSVFINELLFVVNTSDEPKNFWLNTEIPQEPKDSPKIAKDLSVYGITKSRWLMIISVVILLFQG